VPFSQNIIVAHGLCLDSTTSDAVYAEGRKVTSLDAHNARARLVRGAHTDARCLSEKAFYLYFSFVLARTKQQV